MNLYYLQVLHTAEVLQIKWNTSPIVSVQAPLMNWGSFVFGHVPTEALTIYLVCRVIHFYMINLWISENMEVSVGHYDLWSWQHNTKSITKNCNFANYSISYSSRNDQCDFYRYNGLLCRCYPVIFEISTPKMADDSEEDVDIECDFEIERRWVLYWLYWS